MAAAVGDGDVDVALRRMMRAVNAAPFRAQHDFDAWLNVAIVAERKGRRFYVPPEYRVRWRRYRERRERSALATALRQIHDFPDRIRAMEARFAG